MKSLENIELEKLFSRLVEVMKTQKKLKNDDVSSRLIYEIYNMWTTTKSVVLHKSAIWIDPEIANRLIEKGLIQKIGSETDKKYALTLTGIADNIQNKYGKRLDEQFSDFLALVDQKFNTVEQSDFSWKEKLGTLCLILLVSTSESSSIRLNNESNKKILAEVFKKTLDVIKKYGIVETKVKFKTVSRGESIASAHMSRLNKLARKTNHYYKFVGKGSAYYLDIEQSGKIDENKLFFLLGKIFEQFDPATDYKSLNKELQSISQEYSPRFLTRSTDPMLFLNIYKSLSKFIQMEIMKLSMKQ